MQRANRNHAQDASSRSLSNPLRCITLKHLRVCKRVDIYIYMYISHCVSIYICVRVTRIYNICACVLYIYLCVCHTFKVCAPDTPLTSNTSIA